MAPAGRRVMFQLSVLYGFLYNVEECWDKKEERTEKLKKNRETRWAIDYRALNTVTITDSYPLPNIQDNLDKLQGSFIFSVIDAAGAYNIVPVAEMARPLLAFTTPLGL